MLKIKNKWNSGILHNYIIGHDNPSVRIINLVSHTTYVVCVLILYISGETYSLKSTPNDKFFENLFHGSFYLLSEFLLEFCWEEIAVEKYFSYFVSMSGLGLEPWLFV